MTDTKRLAFSIIQFLHDQLNSGGLTSDAQESLEVAMQCLETAFGVSTEDQNLAVSQTLPEIFASAAITHPKVPTVEFSPVPDSPTEEEVAEAERLKTEGNDQMKEENFSAAVGFYSKAIEINPQNAVYYCNRAAAYSKLGNYAGAVQDCELAIGIDNNYSKAYGRMGLALASLNKHTEATGGMGGVDLAGLLNNPGFMSMASNLMNNPQMQQMMSGMMSGAYGSMGATAAPVSGGVGPNDISGLIQAGQQFAQQMQQQNPELIEELRSQVRSRPPSASNEEQP